MIKRHFLIPSLIAAGFSSKIPEVLAVQTFNGDGLYNKPLVDLLRLQHEYQLAGHRSHSSHRSHGSHRSHRSGSGGRAPYVPPPAYTPPAASPTVPSTTTPSRNLQSTPPTSILPRSPATTPKTLPGNTAKFQEITRRVQAALYAQGYYTGSIDGIVGPQTRAAISQFQRDKGLEVNGSITTAVLDALNVAAQ